MQEGIMDSDYHGNDVWDWEQRQTGGELLPQAFCEEGIKRVLAAVGGGLVRKQARREMLQQSRWGGGTERKKKKERDGL